MSNEELHHFLKRKLEAGKKLSRGYNRRNTIFSRGVRMLLNKHENHYDFSKNIEKSVAHIKSLKE